MERKASIMDTTHPDLLQPPHKVAELIRFVAGDWQPDPSRQKQLVAHLNTCSYCRVALIEFLFGVQESEKRLNSQPETPLHDLLMKFVMIHREQEARDNELLGAYAEAIFAAGQEKAEKRFPLLAEHIKRCPSCRSIVEDMLAFLREDEKTD